MTKPDDIPEDVWRAARKHAHPLIPACTGGQRQGSDGVRYHSRGCDRTTEAIARAIMAERERSQWQPIETAPKDGTDIILGAPSQEFQGKPTEPRVTVGHWTTDEECRIDIGDCGGACRCREYDYVDPSWISWDGGFTSENPPTHWMPLPPPQSERGNR